MRVVFLDLDETLLENRQEFSTVYARELSRLGLPRTVAQVEAALGAAWGWYEEHVGRGGEDELAFWHAFNAQVCEHLQAGPLAEQTGAVVTAAFRQIDHPTLFPDALPCLDRLAEAGYALGVITARPDANRVLEPLGIVDRFQWLVDAFRAGSAKQDDTAFRYALDLAGIPAADAVHVGDQVDRDVLPAQAAGMHAVLLDRKDRFPDADCPRLTTLADLPDWLETQR